MLRLPVSGLRVILRQPTGAEDVFLQEMQGATTAAALELIGRLVRTADGAPVDWREVCVSDLEALLLALRQSVLGDLISTEARCPRESCGARVDIEFRIGQFLASRKPAKPRRIEDAGGGWFALTGHSVEFRLPTGGDLLAIDGHAEPYRELARRCMRSVGIPAQQEAVSQETGAASGEKGAGSRETGVGTRETEGGSNSSQQTYRAKTSDIVSGSLKRAEKAMEALAPRFSSNLRGECPECGAAFEVYFDALHFVMRELRAHAASVYQDVHLLAMHYKWPEGDILALPRNRRAAYAEMLGGGGVAA